MTPQKKNRLGNITRVAPRADSKKRQWDADLGNLVFFGREPSVELCEPMVAPPDKKWYPRFRK